MDSHQAMREAVLLAARAVMQNGQHVLMVAEGAERMAQEAGLATVEPSYFSTPARHQFLEGKRLDQVIIGARVQCRHAIAHLVARGQHQHARAFAAGGQRAQHAKAIQSRQAKIQHHEVVGVTGEVAVGLNAVARHVHGESHGAQAARQRGAQAFRIFDQQQLHAGLPSTRES